MSSTNHDLSDDYDKIEICNSIELFHANMYDMLNASFDIPVDVRKNIHLSVLINVSTQTSNDLCIYTKYKLIRQMHYEYMCKDMHKLLSYANDKSIHDIILNRTGVDHPINYLYKMVMEYKEEYIPNNLIKNGFITHVKSVNRLLFRWLDKFMFKKKIFTYTDFNETIKDIIKFHDNLQ